MHELYIAQSIISSVKKSLPAGILPAAVTEVRVQAGQLDAVVPDTLKFLFDAIKSDGGMPTAEIVISEIPVRCCCKSCSCNFGMDLPIFLCPQCGSGSVEVLQGRGIMLTGITATDQQESDNGNTGH
jgi:hydrogenase nickel incorporation protein HypA/HybF